MYRDWNTTAESGVRCGVLAQHSKWENEHSGLNLLDLWCSSSSSCAKATIAADSFSCRLSFTQSFPKPLVCFDEAPPASQ